MDVNPITGRIIAVGADASVVGKIQYTDDDGATTWQDATIESNPSSTNDPNTLYDVRHVGGSIWVVAGARDNGIHAYLPVLASIDDGETWKYCVQPDGLTDNRDDLYSITVSDKRILISGLDGYVVGNNGII